MGTRLRSLIHNVPKPMAAVGDRPFLHYVLDYLLGQGVRSVILSVGYMHEIISGHFGERYKNVDISYSVEREPLGTGGAIRQAMREVAEDYVCVMNGDTLFPIDLSEMYRLVVKSKADVVVAGRVVADIDRYGSIVLEGDRIVSFSSSSSEKAYGIINGGVYLIRNHVFEEFDLPTVFSFEKDFLAANILQLDTRCVPFESYFIDIGIPEDYMRANRELPGMHHG